MRYQVQVFERHDTAGGLAITWRRGDYTFETCLHWLLGSNPGRWACREAQEMAPAFNAGYPPMQRTEVVRMHILS